MKIMTAPGSTVALKDPLTLQAGTIFQGLVALGFTEGTTHQNRSTTDNRAKPATLESMTTASWPLLPGLTSKAVVAQGKRAYYFPNIEEPDIIKPQFQPYVPHPTDRGAMGTGPQFADKPSFNYLKVEQPQFEEPIHPRAQYDYSGPPFIFTLPAAMLKNPLIANDPNMLRLFVKTNGTGQRDTLRLLDASVHVRRTRSASFWDGVEAPNNPRADYQDGNDYDAKARNATRALADIRDPLQPPAGPNDPRPSYNTRSYYNPTRKK
ncbi:MAG: hypothetical protein HZA92_01660 [Verrucomicrobia bacterium]|nr:hypothetical protein [Verrucomicrobiota bacterium]